METFQAVMIGLMLVAGIIWGAAVLLKIDVVGVLTGSHSRDKAKALVPARVRVDSCSCSPDSSFTCSYHSEP